MTPVHGPVSKVIDIGCGTGVVTQELRNYFPSAESVFGIDLSEVDLDKQHESDPAKSRAYPAFIQGDFMTLAGNDPRLSWDSVDFAWSRFLLCGMRDWQGYTDRIFRLLKPGGWAQIVEFCENFHFDPLVSKRPRDFLAENEWEWLRALRDGGRQKGLDLDAGLNVPKYMEGTGFVDIRAMSFSVPYWPGALQTQPEARLAMEHHVDDPYALYWHMIPRMVENMGFTQEQIRQF